MKRRMGKRRSPAEIKRNLQSYYGELTDTVSESKAKKDFKRPAYKTTKLIRKQKEYLHEVPDE